MISAARTDIVSQDTKMTGSTALELVALEKYLELETMVSVVLAWHMTLWLPEFVC
jgi:hypothetical protein